MKLLSSELLMLLSICSNRRPNRAMQRAGSAELRSLAPGATREHVERWVLKKKNADLRGEKAAVSFFEALPNIK